MKQSTARFLILLLSVCLLSACRVNPPVVQDPSDSHIPTEAVTASPTDIPPENMPMEPITTYQNPVLTAETENAWACYGFGDPFVMRHNGVYYLYVSTKDGSVGIRCWSSTDLVNWHFEGFCSNHPVTRGAYAPEVYYYNGYFYMYTSPAGNGHYVLRSTSPTKGFEPVTGNMGMSIDGSVFIDNDGKWYFYTAGHGAIQVYNMTSPTDMENGRALASLTVNDGWTEGAMTVYHDGYYYVTYTGNHVLSPSYRILYGVSDRSPVDFQRMDGKNPLLISTEDAVFGIGHSSTVKGPDLDSYYIVYHSLVNTLPNRNMNIDRIRFNGENMEILGPTTDPTQAPAMPDIYHTFAPGSSLKGWSMEGTPGAGGGGICLRSDSRLISKTPFEGDFTAEYNITSISDGGEAGAIFAYTDDENFGFCCFSPAEQKVIIEMTVKGKTTRREVDTLRSFGEDTRFDCLQALQIERSGRDYTFYMNDRLLCVIPDSDLAGGSIGYITKSGTASFGFIGGTGAVGGNGGADAYKTVSDRTGLIPATEAREPHETVTVEGGVQVVVAKTGDTLSYSVLAAETGLYDLSMLCHTPGDGEINMQISVDGVSLKTVELSAAENGPAALICRGISLSKGQHILSVSFEGEAYVESLCLLKAADPQAFTLDYADRNADEPRYTDGPWTVAGGKLIMPPTTPFGKRLYGSPNMGDYTVEVRVTPASSPNCGLLVRATDPGAPGFLGTVPVDQDAVTATDWVKGYFVGLSSDGVIIGKQSYGYAEVARAAGEYRANQTYTLKVICEGATLQVFVDGQLCLQYTDPEPYMQGMVGVRTHSCAASFDNLTVTP